MSGRDRGSRARGEYGDPLAQYNCPKARRVSVMTNRARAQTDQRAQVMDSPIKFTPRPTCTVGKVSHNCMTPGYSGRGHRGRLFPAMRNQFG